MTYYLGVDIGGTKCALSLAETEGENTRLVDKRAFPTEGTPVAVLEKYLAAMRELLSAHGLNYSDAKSIGVSCGGPLDAKRGIVLSPPNLPGWDHIEVVRFFEERTGIKTALQNDANACALAEWRFGAGRGTENMVFLTFGTGLGAGLICNGALVSGASDMAGEIGHIRLEDDGPVGYGKAGSAEGFCSGGGIGRLAQDAVQKALDRGEAPALLEAAGGDIQAITAKLTAELAFQGDALAKGVYDLCGHQLGRLLSGVIDFLNPERIILGGVFMRSAELIRPEMERVIERETLSISRKACTIVPAGLGEQIGDWAAIGVAVGV